MAAAAPPTIKDELFEASYKGAVFFMTRSQIAGGRKTVVKQIVNSDSQTIEDLGLLQPGFTLTGIVAARPPKRDDPSGTPGQTYKQMRDVLLDALQSKGKGILVHPFHGPIENVVAMSFTLNESTSNVGTATLTLNFQISNTLGVPEELGAVLGTVATAASAATTLLESEVSAEYTVTAFFQGNFPDAVAKAGQVGDTVDELGKKFVDATDTLDQFSKAVSDYAADLAALVEAPRDLSESVSNLVLSLNGLFQTRQSTYDAMKGLFDFGDLDIRFSTDTAGSQERQKNRDLLNSQVQGQALVQAYVSAGALDLPTVEDIEEVSTELEDQFQKMVEADAIDRDSLDAIIETRIALTSFFTTQIAISPRRISIKTHTIPARVLAYALYGSSDQGTTIAELNNVRDDAFVEGEIDILSS